MISRSLVIISLLLVLFSCTSNRFLKSNTNDPANIKFIKIQVSSVNIPVSNFTFSDSMQWNSRVKSALSDIFKNETGIYHGILGFTFFPDRPAKIFICCEPSLKKGLQESLIEKIKPDSLPRTKFGEFAMMIKFSVNDTNIQDFQIPKDCDFEFPFVRKIRKFRSMKLSEQRNFLIRWANKETLPILSLLIGNVDKKFTGVREFSNVICCKEKFMDKSVASLTDSSSTYWQARLEMAIGDNTILLAKCLLYLAHGEIDRALRILQVLNLYQTKSGLTGEYIQKTGELLGIYIDHRNKLIKTGIAAYDRGERVVAISIYKKVIEMDPFCAWAWHEYFLAREFINADTDNLVKFQSEYESHVFTADPLFAPSIIAHTGVEAFRQFRRMQVNELFKNPDSIRFDLLKYANIALDVGAFGLAAELYWQALPLLPTKSQTKAVDGFLYCLEKLGVTSIKSNFVGNPQERYRRVEEKARYRMENSPFYNSMEIKYKKEPHVD